MKNYCKNCKWTMKRWNYTGHWFCRLSITKSWSWVKGKNTEYAKMCEKLNDTGGCANYALRGFWKKLLGS